MMILVLYIMWTSLRCGKAANPSTKCPSHQSKKSDEEHLDRVTTVFSVRWQYCRPRKKDRTVTESPRPPIYKPYTRYVTSSPCITRYTTTFCRNNNTKENNELDSRGRLLPAPAVKCDIWIVQQKSSFLPREVLISRVRTVQKSRQWLRVLSVIMMRMLRTPPQVKHSSLSTTLINRQASRYKKESNIINTILVSTRLSL